MTEADLRLVGQWHRSSADAGATGYAGYLRFAADGLYAGLADPPGAFTWWDGGTWATREPGQLALSTANDAIVTYSYELDRDTLTITDASGNAVTYHRIV